MGDQGTDTGSDRDSKKVLTEFRVFTLSLAIKVTDAKAGPEITRQDLYVQQSLS